MADTPNPVARRAAILLTEQLGPDLAQTIVDTLNAAGMLAQPPAQTPGPFPIYVSRTGIGGADLDLHSWVDARHADLAAQYAEDPDGVGEQLTDLAAAKGGERDELLDALSEQVGGTVLRLTPDGLRRLRDQLTAIASPIPFPHQQDRRAA